jgi:hypothetical protein
MVGIKLPLVELVKVVENKIPEPAIGEAVKPEGVTTVHAKVVPETEGFGKASKFNCVPEHCGPRGAILCPPITFIGTVTVVLGHPPTEAIV